MSARFPGFDVVSQRGHWDPVTAGVVLSRLAPPDPLRFFDPHEQATCTALAGQLLDLGDDCPVPVVAVIDARLAEDQTDGWHYADMPHDAQAWRQSLANLDEDARSRCGSGFAGAGPHVQAQIMHEVQAGSAGSWRGLPAARVWSLWTRYVCSAFYSHPFAFNEIGFPGPAYPRGYKNAGLDRREPFEVADAQPRDPVSPDDDPGRGPHPTGSADARSAGGVG